ncbi:VOC family protein [Nocardiopsis sp. MG754419]|uniref:VOC family protein n=1 Tax=Nocardiopsis sp. MG754419 TaxID=2259865 RepID=UPI001BAA0B2A|nr:VOC family protein [Nocardiopsis sp. MG754419]MBR8744315.1 VOC family protein [Nocardiopsis sp. MG754419]
MMTTDFVTGSPRWVELGSNSPMASADFFKRVFGCEAESAGARVGDYLLMRSEGANVAGIGPRVVDTEPPSWTVYFHVDDIEAASLRVRELGGVLQVEPTEVFELGRMAHATDPQGGWFSLWEPGEFTSMEAADRPGALCWVELWTPSGRGATEFYGGLFGWRCEDIALPGGAGTYTTLGPAGSGEDRYFGGIMGVAPEHLSQTDGAADWHPVFQVADCDATAASVRDADGRVHMGPEDAPGVGRIAVCSDRFSAGFVVLDPRDGGR